MAKEYGASYKQSGLMWFTADDRVHRFEFELSSEVSGICFEAGAAITGFVAFGGDSTNWQGTFNVFEISFGAVTIAGFTSPNGQWAGAALGLGGPFKVGGGAGSAWSTHHYVQTAIRNTTDRTLKSMFRAGDSYSEMVFTQEKV